VQPANAQESKISSRRFILRLSEDNAGALLLPDSLSRAANFGISAKAVLANNDPYSFFAALGDLVVTGPTLTNINDIRAILIKESLIGET
jgi:hydroxypyruvate reductase